MNLKPTPGEIRRMKEKYSDEKTMMAVEMALNTKGIEDLKELIIKGQTSHDKIHEAMYAKDKIRDIKIDRNTSYINKCIGAIATIIGVPAFIYSIIKLKVFGG